MTAGTIGALLGDAAVRLKAAGVELPVREARLLIAHATGLSYGDVIAWPERALSADAVQAFAAAVARRAEREPVTRILGTREFWSLPFRVTVDTLDPRPDTETIVEAALAHLDSHDRPLRILDLGTGTGCILLALLSELPAGFGLGVDRSPAAARVAASNAAALGLARRARVVVGDWATAIGAGFDLVVSNPPYIPSADIAGLAPEVRRYDPLAALDGGADGLAPYRVLAPELARLLVPGGLAVLEAGIGQAEDISRLLVAGGLEPLGSRADLAGIPRAVIGRLVK